MIVYGLFRSSIHRRADGSDRDGSRKGRLTRMFYELENNLDQKSCWSEVALFENRERYYLPHSKPKSNPNPPQTPHDRIGVAWRKEGSRAIIFGLFIPSIIAWRERSKNSMLREMSWSIRAPMLSEVELRAPWFSDMSRSGRGLPKRKWQ